MGILQKQSPYAHISYVLSKLDGRACILSYVIGFAWFLALAHHKLNAPTYFSENALLPGLVESEFYSDYGAEGYNKELKQLLIDQENTDKMYEIPTGWLTQKFRSLGIDTYVQKYSFRYPFGIYEGKNLTGQNVYGIMRAPRSPGTEALVLSVPFRPELSDEHATYPGIALMLALARAFRRHSYWAKDVIFLVTDNEEIGMQAWLSSYHHSPNKYISAGVLPSRSGSIQAAINLEMPSANLGRVNVKFEGLNGKLPNLDLINTVERLFIREGLKITIQEKSRELGINEWSRYLHSLKTMLSMVWHQAPGTPTGNHGYFHKYNIEAVTIQGMKGKVKKPFEFSDTGRVLEGIFRSLNNLLERFHQSFFFYLLPSPNRYVSIGVYMPPFGVMVLPIVIKALASWISLSGDPTADETTKKEKHETEGQGSKSIEENATTEVAGQQSKESNPAPDKPISSTVPDAEPKTVEEFVTTQVIEQELNQSPDKSISATILGDENHRSLDKLSHVSVFVISLLTGVGSFYAADFFVESAYKFHLTQEEGLAIGFLVIHILAMLQPFIFKRHLLKGLNGTLKLDRNFLNCFTLLFFGISIGTISVMNISMAFLVAAAWVPVIFINKATSFRLLAVLKCLVIICVSPFSLLFIGCVVNQILAGFSDNLVSLLGKAWEDLQDGLMVSAFQFYLSDNWTFPLLNFVFLPIWSLFWFIATVND